MTYRSQLKPSDVAAIGEIVKSTGFFHDYEIDIAKELAEENLSKGQEQSGYSFIIAEQGDKPVGYTCYGKTPGTVDSYDLYWIAVHQDLKGSGIGKELMQLTEKDIARAGGKNIWIETSSRDIYEPTRQFYLKRACEKIAELPDFYAINDNKVIFLKRV